MYPFTEAVTIYTLPKAGTHFVKGVLDALGVRHTIRHCVAPQVPEIDLTVRAGVLIRDPRAFFVSLLHWSDRRCREGLLQNRSFPAYPNSALYAPWLAKTFRQKLDLLLNLDPSAPFDVHYIPANFEFITRNLHRANLCFLKFEQIIGSRGGGSDRIQLEAFRRLFGFFGREIADADITRAVTQAWGSSATFNKGEADAWKAELDDQALAVLMDKWGSHLRAWGY
jgi:hypothetical protein